MKSVILKYQKFNDNSIIKPIIVNVVTTSKIGQNVNIQRFKDFGWGIYDNEIYGGICGYVKPPEMHGKVTVFANGKMISVGARSIKESMEQLHLAKFYLTHCKLIQDVKLKTKVRNIVATLTLPTRLQINDVFSKLNDAIYESNRFPGIILKTKTVTFLIFASGKLVINGAKTNNELLRAATEIQNILSRV